MGKRIHVHGGAFQAVGGSCDDAALPTFFTYLLNPTQRICRDAFPPSRRFSIRTGSFACFSTAGQASEELNSTLRGLLASSRLTYSLWERLRAGAMNKSEKMDGTPNQESVEWGMIVRSLQSMPQSCRGFTIFVALTSLSVVILILWRLPLTSVSNCYSKTRFPCGVPHYHPSSQIREITFPASPARSLCTS